MKKKQKKKLALPNKICIISKTKQPLGFLHAYITYPKINIERNPSFLSPTTHSKFLSLEVCYNCDMKNIVF